MRKFITGMCAICTIAALVSCASTKSAGVVVAVETPAPVVQAEVKPEPKPEVKPEPKPEPKFIEVKTWKILSVETAYPDGIVSESVRFKYDEKGNVLKEEQFNGTKVLITQKNFTYDGATGVEIATLGGNGEMVGKAAREMTDGRILKESLFNPKGELQSTEEYTYDAKGQKTRWSVKTSSGNQISSVYNWNNGRLSRIDVLDASASIIKRFDRSYGSGGLLNEEAEYDPAGVLLGKIVYKYEGKSLVQEERQNAAGGVQSVLQYINDADGNPVEIKYLDRSGRLIDVKTQVWQVFTHTEQVQ